VAAATASFTADDAVRQAHGSPGAAAAGGGAVGTQPAAAGADVGPVNRIPTSDDAGERVKPKEGSEATKHSTLWAAAGEGWKPGGRILDVSYAGYRVGDACFAPSIKLSCFVGPILERVEGMAGLVALVSGAGTPGWLPRWRTAIATVKRAEEGVAPPPPPKKKKQMHRQGRR
jgi:hypothetical protein